MNFFQTLLTDFWEFTKFDVNDALQAVGAIVVTSPKLELHLIP